MFNIFNKHKKGVWVFFRPEHDWATYACHMDCGFYYPCFKEIETISNIPKIKPGNPFPFCPACGTKMEADYAKIGKMSMKDFYSKQSKYIEFEE